MIGTRGEAPGGQPGGWTFLTNHTHVMLVLYRNPHLRQRQIAELVGITEGAVQRILNDLCRGGYLEVERIGRCNHYTVHPDLGLRHPLEADHTIGEVLERLAPAGPVPGSLPASRPQAVESHRSGRSAA